MPKGKKKDTGLAAVILADSQDKLGPPEETIEGEAEETMDTEWPGFNAAADEAFVAMRSGDRSAFVDALRAAMTIAKGYND